jgi:hypothetical protein
MTPESLLRFPLPHPELSTQGLPHPLVSRHLHPSPAAPPHPSSSHFNSDVYQHVSDRAMAEHCSQPSPQSPGRQAVSTPDVPVTHENSPCKEALVKTLQSSKPFSCYLTAQKQIFTRELCTQQIHSRWLLGFARTQHLARPDNYYQVFWMVLSRTQTLRVLGFSQPLKSGTHRVSHHLGK